jgi:hypothetical protein
MTTADDASTLDHLTWAYQSLRDAWLTLCLDRECDTAAPWKLWRSGLPTSLNEAQETLLHVAEFTAADAAKSVLHHLRLLARSYPPEALADDGLDPDMWPGFASYTLARGVLEGAAKVVWLAQPLPTPLDLVRNSARLHLWSVSEEQKSPHYAPPPPGEPSAAERMRLLVEAAGFEVKATGRGKADLAVVIDGDPRAFHQGAAIVNLLGDHGKALYHSWSSVTHQAPWALAPWTSVEVDDDANGIVFYTSNFEDKHVELAADVAEIVAAAGKRYGEYYGRRSDEFTTACANVASHMRSHIPAIRQELGRPDADPTRR